MRRPRGRSPRYRRSAGRDQPPASRSVQRPDQAGRHRPVVRGDERRSTRWPCGTVAPWAGHSCGTSRPPSGAPSSGTRSWRSTPTARAGARRSARLSRARGNHPYINECYEAAISRHSRRPACRIWTRHIALHNRTPHEEDTVSEPSGETRPGEAADPPVTPVLASGRARACAAVWPDTASPATATASAAIPATAGAAAGLDAAASDVRRAAPHADGLSADPRAPRRPPDPGGRPSRHRWRARRGGHRQHA